MDSMNITKILMLLLAITALSSTLNSCTIKETEPTMQTQESDDYRSFQQEENSISSKIGEKQ